MADLTTQYLGYTLKSPLVVSPSPLCTRVDNIKRMEDAGAAAVVLQSLFEEQLAGESDALNANLLQGTESFAESLSYFPEMSDYHMGPEAYLELIAKAKAAVSIPVFASLNGVSHGGWVDYSKEMEQAGADAIELNVYFIPTDPEMPSEHVDAMYLELLREVRAAVKVPVAMKIAPQFTSIPNMAKRMAEAGADALVLFNRFYQPDFDLERLEVVSDIQLSSPSRLHLRLRWAAILFGRIQADLGITGGVHSPEDVVKCMMAGGKVAMMASALLKYGIGHLSTVTKGIERWMDEHEYDAISTMQGSMSQRTVANPSAFERAHYMKMLTSYVPGA